MDPEAPCRGGNIRSFQKTEEEVEKGGGQGRQGARRILSFKGCTVAVDKSVGGGGATRLYASTGLKKGTERDSNSLKSFCAAAWRAIQAHLSSL